MLHNVTNWAKQFLQDESGPTAVEYAVMLALIIAVCSVSIGTLGSNANKTFGNTAAKISASVGT